MQLHSSIFGLPMDGFSPSIPILVLIESADLVMKSMVVSTSSLRQTCNVMYGLAFGHVTFLTV